MTMDKGRHTEWPYHVMSFVRDLECRRNHTKLNPGHTLRETCRERNRGEYSTFVHDAY